MTESQEEEQRGQRIPSPGNEDQVEISDSDSMKSFTQSEIDKVT